MIPFTLEIPMKDFASFLCPHCNQPMRFQLDKKELIAFCLNHEHTGYALIAPFVFFNIREAYRFRDPLLFRKYFYSQTRGVEVWEP